MAGNRIIEKPLLEMESGTMDNVLENEPVRSLFCDDEDFLELIEMFVDGIEEKKTLLRAASTSDQVEELRVLAHQLKGASAGYGFEELSQIAAELEIACKSGDQPGIEHHKEIMLKHMDRIVV